MKIYCDYCGTQIDTELHRNCPNCGGSYAGDEEIIKEQERLDKLNDLEIRREELRTDRMELENSSYMQKMRSEKEITAFRRIIKYVLIAMFVGFFIYAMVRAANMMDRAEDRMAENSPPASAAETAE